MSCKVVCDKNGSKGYGFDLLKTQEAAIKKMDIMLLKDCKVFVGNSSLEKRGKLSSVPWARNSPGLYQKL